MNVDNDIKEAMVRAKEIIVILEKNNIKDDFTTYLAMACCALIDMSSSDLSCVEASLSIHGIYHKLKNDGFIKTSGDECFAFLKDDTRRVH